MEKRANEVFLNDKSIIESIFHGAQTEETVSALATHYKALCEQLKKEGKPIYSLVDMNDITHADAGARNAVLPILQNVSFQKIALFGGNTVIRTLAKFMAYVSKDLSSMRYFETRNEAEQWLSP